MAVWQCVCGRRVPGAVQECHCGTTRQQAAAAVPTRGPTYATAAPRGTARRPWRLRTAAGVFLVVVSFFSARSCRLAGPEEEARLAAMDMLGARMNRRPALEAFDKYHPSCFAEHCHDAWQPWRKPDFDRASYVQCMTNRVRVEAGFAPLPIPTRRPRPVSSEARLSTTPRPPAVETVVPTEGPAETPTEAPTEGRLFIGEAKGVSFRRQPQLSAHVRFMALGTAALLPRAMCSYTIVCGGEVQGVAEGQRVIVPCVTVDADGLRASGSLEVTLVAPAPPQAACHMDLALSDGEHLRSDSVVVPLR